MSIPTLADLVGAWRDALVADADLASFCTTNFAKSCTHYVGYDAKNPPGIAQTPFIVILPMGTVDGQADGMFSWRQQIYFAISDNTFSDYQTNGATEMKAFYLVDEMRGIVKDAIDALASSNNLVADSVSYEIDMDHFPMVVGSIVIETRFTNTIGANFSL